MSASTKSGWRALAERIAGAFLIGPEADREEPEHERFMIEDFIRSQPGSLMHRATAAQRCAEEFARFCLLMDLLGIGALCERRRPLSEPCADSIFASSFEPDDLASDPLIPVRLG